MTLWLTQEEARGFIARYERNSLRLITGSTLSILLVTLKHIFEKPSNATTNGIAEMFRLQIFIPMMVYIIIKSYRLMKKVSLEISEPDIYRVFGEWFRFYLNTIIGFIVILYSYFVNNISITLYNLGVADKRLLLISALFTFFPSVFAAFDLIPKIRELFCGIIVNLLRTRLYYLKVAALSLYYN